MKLRFTEKADKDYAALPAVARGAESSPAGFPFSGQSVLVWFTGYAWPGPERTEKQRLL
jgi:hypothetical protein